MNKLTTRSNILLYPPLTREQEAELSRRILGGTREAHRALERLVMSHLRIVIRVAARYRHLGLPFEDLVNEGILGLMAAATRFDPARGTRFFSYAGWWVRKSILKAVTEKSTVVRIPDYQRIRMSRQRAGRDRAAATARAHDDATPAAPVPNLLIVSLEDPTGTRGRTLLETMNDREIIDPEHQTMLREQIEALHKALACLNGRERLVLTGRYGLSGDRILTLEEIAGTMGVSRERVRQIEKRACHTLRERMSTTPRAAAG